MRNSAENHIEKKKKRKIEIKTWYNCISNAEVKMHLPLRLSLSRRLAVQRQAEQQTLE